MKGQIKDIFMLRKGELTKNIYTKVDILVTNYRFFAIFK